MATQQSATTQFINASNGTRFAYRRIGESSGVPLMMHIHFRANMDFWDPLLINNLTSARPIIIFDQAGVGRSTGTIPTTYQGWANEVIALIEALGIKKIDLLGFSMGGAAMQMVALSIPNIVRKLILAGTGPSMPSESSDTTGIVWPREASPPEPMRVLSAPATTLSEVEYALAFSFFPETDEGRKAASAYWARVLERNVPTEPPLLTYVDQAGAARQAASWKDWTTPNPNNSFDRLGEMKMPVLVINGDNDVLVPTSQSWEMSVKIPNAQLIIYPKSGHGFLYQYAEAVAKHVNEFLDGGDVPSQSAKL